MSKVTTKSASKTLNFPFYSVRHITCPEDQGNERKVYVGYTPVAAVIALPTDEDVRDYILEAEGRQPKRPTQVHRAIQDTLENTPHNFSVLNSGVVIVARGCEINENDKMLVLKNPSIVNGAQTQGIIRDFVNSLKRGSNEKPDLPAHVKFEVIVTDNDDLIAEISIARNFQNDVMTLSIAGRRGQLDELEKSLQNHLPEKRLQKSETKLSDDYVKTERLLQVITALIPEEIWPKGKEFNKVYTYSMKAKCLKEFQALYVKAKDPTHPENRQSVELYQFYLDIAADALDIYESWKTHQGFQGTGLRSIEREGREIREVPDGIIFPIISSLSAFAKRTKDGWKIEPPTRFRDEVIIGAAKSAYINIAFHNPWNMGKNKACYAYLHQITSIFKELSR